MQLTVNHQCSGSLAAKHDEKSKKASLAHARRSKEIDKAMFGHLLVLDKTLEHVELLENSRPVVEHRIIRLCSHRFKRLESLLGTILVEKPSRRLWEKRDADGENQGREALDGQRQTPLSAGGVDKVECEANPAGDGVADADHDSVDADEEAADARGGDFGLVERDEHDDGACWRCQHSCLYNKKKKQRKRKRKTSRTYSQTSDESKDEIHGDVNAPSLQRPSNERNKSREEDGALSPKHVCGFDARQAANKAAGLEESVDGAYQLRGVGPRIKAKVGDEGRLAQRGGDDAGAVAIGHAAEGNEAHDLRGRLAICP